MGDIRTIRNRIIAGLFVLMPLFITFAIIRWLYDTLYSLALGPISSHLKSRWLPRGDEASFFLDSLFSLAAFVLILAFLFVAGMFFRSRIHRSIDWILLNVPGVSSVYSAVNNVFQALSKDDAVDLAELAELSGYKFDDFMFMIKKRTAQTKDAVETETVSAPKNTSEKSTADLLEAEDDSEA